VVVRIENSPAVKTRLNLHAWPVKSAGITRPVSIVSTSDNNSIRFSIMTEAVEQEGIALPGDLKRGEEDLIIGQGQEHSLAVIALGHQVGQQP
jgi:hypothetical protein